MGSHPTHSSQDISSTARAILSSGSDILTPIPVLEPQFIHDVEELSLLDARSITYSVAAVGYTGVGYRSSPLLVELGP